MNVFFSTIISEILITPTDLPNFSILGKMLDILENFLGDPVKKGPGSCGEEQ